MRRKKKDYIVPDYEIGRPMMAPDPVDQWWEEPEMKVEATRSARQGRVPKPSKEPRKTRVSPLRILMILLVVGLVLFAFLLMINDLRGGDTAGDKNPTVAVEQPRQVDGGLPSPDTIKNRLEKAGYEVYPLVDTYNEFSYDVAETKIEGRKAEILVFTDDKTTRGFGGAMILGKHTAVVGKLWAISFGKNTNLETKQLAEKIAGEFDARFLSAPEGE